MDEHLIELGNLADRLNIENNKGLISKKVKKRLLFKSPNVLTPVQQTPKTMLFLKTMFGGLASVLWIVAILILCIDIGTNLLSTISLAYEKPEIVILRRASRTLEDKLIAFRFLIYSYIQLALLQTIADFINYGIIWRLAGYTAREEISPVIWKPVLVGLDLPRHPRRPILWES